MAWSESGGFMSWSCERCVRALARRGLVVAGVVCAAVVLGCSPSPGARSCRVDADCGAAATCQSGVCQIWLRLAISSPGSGVATNGTLQVQVSVEGGSPAEVELVVDELPLLKVGSPYQYSWDTSATPEGAHKLWARVVAGDRTYESARIDVTVDRTAPPAPTLTVASPTNAQPVPIGGAAEASATVTVYEGTAQLAQALVNASGTWSATAALVDGPHQLIATATDAAGNVSAPGSASVACVRANPTILARTPPPEASNVWSRDTISVRFTRALDGNTVNKPGTVQYTVNGQPQVATSSLKAPDPDGTQTLIVKPQVLPEVGVDGATVGVALSNGITDLSGNALPGDAWTWNVPAWQELGEGVHSDTVGLPTFVLAADALAQPMIASLDVTGMRGPWRWSGSTWLEVASLSPAGMAKASMAFLDDGTPMMAWTTYADNALHVSEYVGDNWTPSTILSENTAVAASAPDLRVDPQGRAVVAWTESSSGIVKRWNGSGWDKIGTSLSTARPLRLSFTAGGEPVVSYEISGWSSTSWSGSAWTFFAACNYPGDASADYTTAVYRVTASGDTYLALKTTTTPVLLLVYKCTRDGVYLPLLGGGALNSSGAGVLTHAMELTSAGMPVVAWTDGTYAGGAKVYVRRWNGLGWEPLGGDLAVGMGAAYGAWLSLDPSDVIVTAIEEAFHNDSFTAHLKRYNR